MHQRKLSTKGSIKVFGRLVAINPVNPYVMKVTETSTKVKTASKVYDCWICKGNHCLMQCDEFRKMGIKERKQNLRKHKLCWNCFPINDWKLITANCRESARKGITRFYIIINQHLQIIKQLQKPL